MGWSHRLQALLYNLRGVRNLLVHALRATPRRNRFQRNRGLWDVAHLPGDARSGLRKDTTTKPGLLRGPGRDPTPVGWGRSWPDAGVGMSRSRPPSKSTGWYGWDGRYATPEASPPISPAASPDPTYATNDTKAPAATCASTNTAAADSTKTSTTEPHTMTTDPRPDQYQHQSQSSPDSDSPFR